MSNRSWLYLGLIFFAFWIVVVVRFDPLGNPVPSGPAEFQWKLRDLEGQPVDFARFRGKTIFLNIWATWCPPCVEEMPSIAALAANPKLKDVAFVCVSVDDSAEPVKKFLADKSWPMTMLHAGAEPLPRAYRSDGVPSTFLIGPDGVIATAEYAPMDWDNPKTVELLEKLARGGKATP